MTEKTTLEKGDALIVADIQKDFLPGGRLEVRDGDKVIDPLNQAISLFYQKDLPVIFTRDWHPLDHCSFESQGGPWPVHCVQGSVGAQLSDAVHLPPEAIIVSKATQQGLEAYSVFKDTEFHELLQHMRVKRLFIGGLTTEYCVLNTVKDALARSYEVFVLSEAVRGVNLQPDNGKLAIEEMHSLGAKFIDLSGVEVWSLAVG